MQHFASTRRALFGLGRGGGGGKEGGASGILFAWGCSGVSPLRLSIHREERKENPILVVCVWPRGEWINSNPIKQTPNRVKGNTVSFFYFRFSSCFFFLSLCVCVCVCVCVCDPIPVQFRFNSGSNATNFGQVQSQSHTAVYEPTLAIAE